MEENSIQMFMDVKLDLRERKPEFQHLKTWTKYLVKIEAIKFFPSFVKISFLKHPNEEYTNLIVRIHIPGLNVEMTTSRTKPHSYGLFWKHNRKICCIYLAFDTKLVCDKHFEWMKTSIKNLELYRQDVLLTRRASRITSTNNNNKAIDTEIDDECFNMYQNLKNVRDVNEILGPLPKTPDAALQEQNLQNWLRRSSGVSEIYEEIENRPSTSCRKSRLSRASIASGIYEEMRIADVRSDPISEETTSLSSPPPLPPRSRKNTSDCDADELKRSYTNPEQDFFKKKKHWLIFETMFGRGTKQRITSSVKKSAKQDTVDGLKRRDKSSNRFDFELARNKRNSFSSPDLSNLHVYSLDDEGSSLSVTNLEVTQESIICSDLHSLSLDQFNISDDFLNDAGNFSMLSQEEEAEIHANDPFANISQCIKPNFNISTRNHDISSINLVGRSFKSDAPQPVVNTMNMVDGYVVMRPIANKQQTEEKLSPADVEKPKLPEKVKLLPLTPQRKHLEADEEDHYKSPITFRRESEYTNEDANRDSGIRSLRSSDDIDPEIIYENMTSILANHSPGLRSMPPNPGKSDSTTPFYASIEFSFDDVSSLGGSPVQETTKAEQKTMNRRSVDRVSSYFPNVEFPAKAKGKSTPSPKMPKKKTHTRSKTDDITAATLKNVLKTPERNRKQKTACVTSSQKSIPNIYVVTQAPATPNAHLSPIMLERKNSLPAEPTEPKELLTAPLTPRGYRKYETLMTRISPSKYFEKTGARRFDTASIRRFASLPRFKKLDLSPLKMKINNVLQRHQTEGV